MGRQDLATDLHLRAWRPGDAEAVAAIVGQAHPLQQWLDRWVLEAPEPERAKVAIVDERPVGIVVRRHSAIHPAKDWAAVHVAPEHRGGGLGHWLIDSIREAGSRPLRIRAVEGTPAVAFAERCGFRRVIRCVETTIVAGSATADRVHGLAREVARRRLRVSRANLLDLLDALRRVYEDAHRWEPPAPLSEGDWHAVLLGASADGSGRVVRDADGRIVAAGVLHDTTSSTDSVAHVAFCGPVDQAHPLAAGATALLLDHYAAMLDGPLSVECDLGWGANDALAAALGLTDAPGALGVVVLAERDR